LGFHPNPWAVSGKRFSSPAGRLLAWLARLVYCWAMSEELPEVEFQRFWRRLQQLGLNAYEARSYLVLLGHPRFKALELAARAHVPRQKIYEVLDSLLEKGFAQVVQEKTKLFSAVEPALAIPGFLTRKRHTLEHALTDQGRIGTALVDDLKEVYSEGQGGRGTLDFLRIVTDPSQTGAEYRKMLSEVNSEYLEFSRPPYAVDPLGEQLVKQARARGACCRILLEAASWDHEHRHSLDEYAGAGVEIRQVDSLPMKLAVFDGREGLIALLDPVITRPSWTAVVFNHEGMGQAMKGLFEEYWRRGRTVTSEPLANAEPAAGEG
jgi:HTH-type transcriptional regulator, sugar sensing transcriptional regulator